MWLLSLSRCVHTIIPIKSGEHETDFGWVELNASFLTDKFCVLSGNIGNVKKRGYTRNGTGGQEKETETKLFWTTAEYIILINVLCGWYLQLAASLLLINKSK